MAEKRKYGVYDLSGEAVEKIRFAPDDNHSDDADEEKALDNFSKFSHSFLNTQREFLNNPKLK